MGIDLYIRMNNMIELNGRALLQSAYGIDGTDDDLVYMPVVDKVDLGAEHVLHSFPNHFP